MSNIIPCARLSPQKIVLEKAGYDGLCEMLGNHSSLLGDCSVWPFNFSMPDTDEEKQSFLGLNAIMQRYAGENLARLQVIIKAPSVHVVKRDVSITFISYIGSLGGLLGLCLGFSFISLIEFVYHLLLNRVAGSCCGDGSKHKGKKRRRSNI